VFGWFENNIEPFPGNRGRKKVNPGSATPFFSTLNQGKIGTPSYPFMFSVKSYVRNSQQMQIC